nr:uncharacterized protein LOC118680005 [Bactrocera oleae]
MDCKGKASNCFECIRYRYPNIDNEVLDILYEHTSLETSINLRAFTDKYRLRTGKEFSMHRGVIRATEFLHGLSFLPGEIGNAIFFRLEPFQ